MARQQPTPQPTRRRWPALLLGILIGGLGALALVVLVGMPLALQHRADLPLERLYADFAVEAAVRTQAGNAANPVANNPRALETGRNAYTGSCAVCHGATGDGQGRLGPTMYPPASDLRAHDTQEKTDAQLFWITKNGLSFAGMPGFGGQHDDQTIWALVSYMRVLAKGNAGALAIPTATPEQLAMADPTGDAVHQGAALYFAQGCAACHGAVGNAPGDLRLRPNDREAQETIRRGKQGMPAYPTTHLSDGDLQNLIAYMNTFPNTGPARR